MHAPQNDFVKNYLVNGHWTSTSGFGKTPPPIWKQILPFENRNGVSGFHGSICVGDFYGSGTIKGFSGAHMEMPSVRPNIQGRSWLTVILTFRFLAE